MKAVRIFDHGGVDKLVYGDFPMPEIGPRDVRVQVTATGVSLWDIKYRRGELPVLPGRPAFPMPMQLGRDAAGRVEAVGRDVTAFAVGDRVVGLVHPANPASALTVRGFGNLSTEIEYPGHTLFGGNAQFVARPESYWMKLPSGASESAAAAALWSYSTAHRILADRLGAHLGDSVLLIGASGGMGSATLDLAELMGLRVIAVTRSAQKKAFLEARGAAAVVVLSGKDDAAAVRAYADQLGVDGAIDYSGDPTMLKLAIDVLRPGGTLVVAAVEGGGGPVPLTTRDCLRLEINLRGARASTLNDQRCVIDLLGQGKIEPAIHTVLPLSAIGEAHTLLESGTVSGRILLDPWGERS
ncbi:MULTISPECIES: zinc-binding alcohol dehydrogenase family protein [unclassified Beijerinckia]|uniref:quinone oxidoreductase family protein n=1 Tax=unclassified Beijerinckia TaxID=2638183 RepID=UPI000899FF9C|nr:MULTISPECIES: zinc-binding alcohol dehydrogenase family protein [unclassified Beijerinckia]MDH7797211.1 NADPH:quinone reductase-like Zn-dependent oxidoreductase [Beijerinckia sp. GAS462]SEC76474.1 putative oxidoreductase [Beijerinckia sp. 28-YEA-48]